MQQKIIAPDEEWITYIAKMWLLGSEISMRVLGEEMDGTKEDLSRLQRIVDSGPILADQTQKLQALGIIFGKVFVNHTPDYDWWVVEDEYGKDACVRYKQTTLLAFPQTMISKRIEEVSKLTSGTYFQAFRKTLRGFAERAMPGYNYRFKTDAPAAASRRQGRGLSWR